MHNKIIDLGCGIRKKKGAIGVDINTDTKADIIYDLDTFPYPFKDNLFDIILCCDILEHLTETIKVMEEIHRIGKPHAIVKIKVPHYACWWGWSDPTHKKLFSPFSFNHFIENKPHQHYSKINYKIVSTRVTFHRIFRWIGLEFLANKFLVRYEQFFTFIFRPDEIYFELEVLKKNIEL